MLYHGSCHCGAIQFQFDHAPIETGLTCNCSLCRRKGAIMSAFTLSSDELKIHTDNSSLATYTFGSHIAQHHFCKICGIYPFHQTLRKPGHYRINLHCLDDFDTSTLRIEPFNGAAL